MTGKSLAHYEILELLGRGGMGYVYLCRDLVLDERVALKLMPRKKEDEQERSAKKKKRADGKSAGR